MEPPVPRLELITVYVLTEATGPTLLPVRPRSLLLIVNYTEECASVAIPQKRYGAFLKRNF